jgi:hypothetical protein
MAFPPAARPLLLAVGIGTLGFGFLAGALLNVFLWIIQDPLAAHFRTSLTYPSAILGDGLVLPLVNMLAATFLWRERWVLTPTTRRLALLGGTAVTMAFHIYQASHGLVNWTMPEPWHWNLLGLYHATYMLTVCTLLCLFLCGVIRHTWRHRQVPTEAVLVALGVVVFFGLLRLDYVVFNLT